MVIIMNMKLTGNKRKGNHLGKTAEKTAAENVLSDDGVSTDKKKLSKKKKIIIIVLASILALAAGVTAYAYFFIRSALSTPPPVRESPRGSEMIQVPNASNIPARQSGEQTGQESPDDDDVVETPRGGRDMTKYTFLILGTDLGDFNTDVIMVATLDTTNNTLIITNIPRDTMANVSWDLKKANSILSNMRLIYRGQDDFDKKVMDATVEAFSDILGFKVDYWVHVNMRAFISLINAIDGVDFYVPVNMNYDDPAQNLSIHYSRGMHHLYGQQALEVLRFRSGYSNADIGRIGTQQEFLKSAAEQILAKKSSINILELADIFIGNVKTDISLDNLIWFGRELLRLEVDNIIFQTLPGLYIDYVGAQSYVTIFVDEWLEMINSTVSPFYDEITKDDVSILTRGEDRYLYVTDGNRLGNPSWGANSRGPTRTTRITGPGRPVRRQGRTTIHTCHTIMTRTTYLDTPILR